MSGDTQKVMKVFKFLGASEIDGGALILLGGIVAPDIPLWYQIASLLVGSYAIAAGIWTWENSPVGYWLSLPLQAVQIFQIVTGTFLMKPIVGIHASVFVWTNGGFSISPGFSGTLGIWDAGHGEYPGVGVNLLAFALIYLLFLAIRSNAGTAFVGRSQQQPISPT